IMVSRFKNGLKNDGPAGEPGHQIFNEQHFLVLEEHFKESKLHDGVNGEPAFQVFDGDTGRMERVTHFKDGTATKMASFNYSDTVVKEEELASKGPLKRIFSK